MKQIILVTDCDENVCGVYAQFLAERGYDVETSADGLDCLTKLRQMTPAMIVLDLGLHWGGADGILDWLREESPTHGIPIILTGTLEAAADVSEMDEPSVVDYLRKPFTAPTLLEKIQAVIAKDGSRKATNPRRAASEIFIG